MQSTKLIAFCLLSFLVGKDGINRDENKVFFQYISPRLENKIQTFSKLECIKKGDSIAIHLNEKQKFFSTSIYCNIYDNQQNLFGLESGGICIYYANIYHPIIKKIEIDNEDDLTSSISIKIDSKLFYNDTIQNSIDTLRIWGEMKIKK